MKQDVRFFLSLYGFCNLMHFTMGRHQGPHPQPFPRRGRGREIDMRGAYTATILPSPAAAGEGLGMGALVSGHSWQYEITQSVWQP